MSVKKIVLIVNAFVQIGGGDEPYYYVKRGSLVTTCYTLEDDDICNCWTVKDYIENHMIENKENVIMNKKLLH